MTIQDTGKIKQQPVTTNMTTEELKKYRETVREARQGNTGSFDYEDAWRGRCFQTEQRPLSDEIPLKPTKESNMQYVPTSAKAELIIKWTNSIEKLEKQIEKIKADKTLSTADRQKKIARRLEIIANYRASIKQTKEYMEFIANRDREILNKFMKQK